MPPARRKCLRVSEFIGTIDRQGLIFQPLANFLELLLGVFLGKLDGIIGSKLYLFGDRASLADLAILPFVRQFANTDRTWFDDQGWPHVVGWLDRFLESERFKRIMGKFAPWEHGQDPVVFPVDARN